MLSGIDTTVASAFEVACGKYLLRGDLQSVQNCSETGLASNAEFREDRSLNQDRNDPECDRRAKAACDDFKRR